MTETLHEGAELIVPSKLSDPNIPHHQEYYRDNVLRRSAENAGITITPQYVGDEQFWHEVGTSYIHIIPDLRKDFPEATQKQLEVSALRSAVRETTSLMNREQQRAIDPLTGAWNRRIIDNYLTNILERNYPVPETRRQNPSGVGVLFFDIDKFKDINDTYGHEQGDKILKQLVETLSNAIRPTDMLGRYGGEEFIAVCPGMNPDQAKEKAEKLRELIEEKMTIDGRPVTVSVGVTNIQPQDTHIDQLYKRADDGLYAAKHLGRNKAVAHAGVTMDGYHVFEDVRTAKRHVEMTGIQDGKPSKTYTPYTVVSL